VEHVKYIVDKVEKAQETNKKEPFRPYKTTKSNVHDPVKEKQRKLHKNWEITAATPPLIVHEAAKVLNLNESLKLQKEQSEKLQVCNIFKITSSKFYEELSIHFFKYILINFKLICMFAFIGNSGKTHSGTFS